MNWKRSLIGVGVAVPIIGLLAFGFMRDPRAIPSPLPGHEAPAFDLAVFAPGEAPLARKVGDTLRLREFAGKVVVVNFWASWCLQCQDEHRDLSETARAYADRPTQFVGVLYNDRTTLGTRWISEMGGQSYPSVTDDRSRAAINYGLYGVPETFIIAPDGRIAYKHLGPISSAVLGKWIDSLLTLAPRADTTAVADK
ncbi:MAG TPA: redoxin domain-containing protein [Gemmatimonadaceae bacterium]|nr:redoxin domain-containing protein [Gemmatimonadaceae bacterium]